MRASEDDTLANEQRFVTTRRQFLQSAAALGIAATSGSVLGSLTGSASAAVPKRASAAVPKRGGTLLVGLSGAGPTDTLDPQRAWTEVSLYAQKNLYHQFANTDVNFNTTLQIAESIEPNADATEWTIRAKPGVEFHNGKTLDAEDMIFTMQRMLNPAILSGAGPLFAAVDPKEITKLDSRTIRLKLLYPLSYLPQCFGDGPTGIVPVGFDLKKPVGAGPFKYKSFSPGQLIVMERFANFYGEPAYIDELHLIGINDDAARVNALLSGQVHAIDTVPYAESQILAMSPGVKLLNSPGSLTLMNIMRVDVPPFNDVRVRQAIRLCVDRNQMVNVVLSGHGTKANDLYAPYDPAFDNSLVRNQDIAQAKWLLKQAGHEKLTVSLISDSEVGGEVEMCEVLAADAAKAGITINYRQLDTATYDRMEYKWPFATDWWPGFHFLTMTALSLLPGASINETHFNDHEFNTLYAEAASELNETKRTELIHEMQKIFFDRGSFLIPIYLNTLGGYSDKVAGFTHDLTGDGLGQAGFDRVYFV